MSRFSTLSQWLAWQETCHPNSIDLGLARVQCVADRLNLLYQDANVITIAGTNGKGSCAKALETILVSSGCSVGVYSSPHIQVYNERIRLNGSHVDDSVLVDAFNVIDGARGELSLTYFEFGTLAAMYIFAQQKVDYWVLEVGLGGRLDATNIIEPTVAVITSIGLDHCDWLGDTREAIGFEKSGICRQNKPLVCSEPTPPSSVVETAERLKCPTYWINKDFGWHDDDAQRTFWLSAQAHQSAEFSVDTQLAAPSVAAALQVARLLGVPKLNAWPDALKGVCLPGRVELAQYENQNVIMDVAHNAAAFEFLTEVLSRRWPGSKFTVVLGMMADKNIGDSIVALAPVVSHWVLLDLHNPRAAKPTDIQNMITHVSPGSASIELLSDAKSALQRATQRASKIVSEHVLVTGSFYTVADVRNLLCEPDARKV